MTLALAMIMIVIIGVMGAGLITFVNRDLNTVAEENRGQRAFEMADAGVRVAKRELNATVPPTPTAYYHYDDTQDEVIGEPDNQWSWINGGVTLNDLDGDAGDSDSAPSKSTTGIRRTISGSSLRAPTE